MTTAMLGSGRQRGRKSEGKRAGAYVRGDILAGRVLEQGGGLVRDLKNEMDEDEKRRAGRESGRTFGFVPARRKRFVASSKFSSSELRRLLEIVLVNSVLSAVPSGPLPSCCPRDVSTPQDSRAGQPKLTAARHSSNARTRITTAGMCPCCSLSIASKLKLLA